MNKISKKLAKEKIDQLELIDEFEEVKLSNKKIKLTFIGTKKDNMKKSNFENSVLEFMKNMDEFVNEQREFNKKVDSRFDKIETRLNNIEKRIENIENTPTMKKELI